MNLARVTHKTEAFSEIFRRKNEGNFVLSMEKSYMPQRLGENWKGREKEIKRPGRENQQRGKKHFSSKKRHFESFVKLAAQATKSL